MSTIVILPASLIIISLIFSILAAAKNILVYVAIAMILTDLALLINLLLNVTK
jgi:hypothetical protein